MSMLHHFESKKLAILASALGFSIFPVKAEAACLPAAQILAALKNLGSTHLVTTIRHRGDFDADTPENSLRAFHNSYAKCRPGVETDIRTTQDYKLVLFHDVRIGKMLQPFFLPETDPADSPYNGTLISYNLSDLKSMNLVKIDRTPTDQKIVTFDEILDDYVSQNAQSLLYFEFKDRNDILEAARLFDLAQKRHPDIDFYERVIFKFSMSVYPLFSDWVDAYAQLNLQKRPLVQVQLSSQIAQSLPSMENSVQSWSSQPDVLSVEVTMKDSSGYINRQRISRVFGTQTVAYLTPSILDGSNTRAGTMARAIAIVRGNNKPLGQFVPIPDWVMWRKATDPLWNGDWFKQLRNLNLNNIENPSIITPRQAYFNNNSLCCYALDDRLNNASPDPEQFDQRILLPWMEDLNATILTADDTDNINAYFKSRGILLDLQEVSTPDPAMNSAIDLTRTWLPNNFVLDKRDTSSLMQLMHKMFKNPAP